MLKVFGMILIVLFAVSGAGGANASPESLRKAIKAYQAGEYEEASELYLPLALTQANASLFHNLGLSFYRAGEFGAAVAAYVRAQQLRPRDPDLAYNLNFLLAKASDRLEPKDLPSSVDKVLRPLPLSLRESFFLLVALFVFTGGVACLWLWRRTSGVLILLGASGLLLAYGGASHIWTSSQQKDWGAITAPQAGVYTGPADKNAVVIFQLKAGAPFAVLDQSEGWIKLKLSDGKMGWVREEHVAVFGSSYKIYQKSKVN